MSNFFRVTDSPFGGVIPASVLRKAMEQREKEAQMKENIAEGAAVQDPPQDEGSDVNRSMPKQELVNTSADQQGSFDSGAYPKPVSRQKKLGADLN